MLSATITKIATRLLHKLPPESAHHLALNMLEAGIYLKARPDDARLKTTCLGQTLSNPIGLAAGFDKDCRAAKALSHLGFGFVECGTVTPRPQPGNPTPRLFRLREDGALINRLGFNSKGAQTFARRLQRLRAREAQQAKATAIGVNLGINKEGAQPAQDYAALATQFGVLADYLTINLSSPNTPGLRSLQGPESIASILSAITTACPLHPPLLIKLAPDLDDDNLPSLIEACITHGAAGLIVSNTTISRPDSLRSEYRHETGGLSGRPLSQLAINRLKHVVSLAQGRLVIISSGGIETGFDVYERLRIGADLVQLYTGFIYEGPEILKRIKAELVQEMNRHGQKTIAEICARPRLASRH